MDKVYLINQFGTDNYKIGYTRGSIDKRLKTLQTGTPDKLILITHFESEYAKLIESTFHRLYKSRKVNGEWFELSANQVTKFKNECIVIENNFKHLEEHNSIFKHRK